MTSFRESVKYGQRKLEKGGTDLIGKLEAAARMDDERAGSIHSITAFIGFLSDAGAPDRHTAKLRRLRDALDDLDRGIVAPVLAPVKVSHRPPASAAEMRIRTFAVLLAEAGKARGHYDTLDDAYEKVAAISGRVGLPVSPVTIRRWRKSLTEHERRHALPEPDGHGVDVESAALYREMADKDFRSIAFNELKEKFKAMIEQLKG